MATPTIKIEKLETPIYEGDWHDKPLRWRVVGPGQELQNFSTKSSARHYAKIRRRSPDANTASNAFVRASVHG
jgi:hypothetical protein